MGLSYDLHFCQALAKTSCNLVLFTKKLTYYKQEIILTGQHTESAFCNAASCLVLILKVILRLI